MATIDDLIRETVASAVAEAVAPLVKRLAALEGTAAPAPVPSPAPAPTPAPAPPVPAPASPAPLPAGSTSPAVGNGVISAQLAEGPPDRIDLTGLPKARPWRVYSDPANLIFAPSCEGKRPDSVIAMHVYGYPGNLYHETPVLIDGVIRMRHPSNLTRADTAAGALALSDPRGTRGDGIVSPATTWIGHRTLRKPGALENPSPDGAVTNRFMPLYLGLRVDGMLMFAQRDGNVSYVGHVPSLAPGAQDLTMYPPNGLILFIADTFAGRVVKLDRRDSKAAILPMPSGKIEPASKWHVETFVSGLGKPTGLRCAEDGTLFVADNAAGIIWRYQIIEDGVVPLTGQVLCKLPGVFAIDTRSDGSLVAVTEHFAVHIISSDGAVGPNLMPAYFHSPGVIDFVTVSVDREGTMGPRDQFVVSKVQGESNNTVLLFESDGTFRGFPWGTNGGHAVCGPAFQVEEAFGHYPWVASFHPDQAVMMTQGLANAAPWILRPPLPSDPPYAYDASLFWHGRLVILAGGRVYGKQPSFVGQISISGGGAIVDADEIADMPWADSAAFIRKGMRGSVPRDDLTPHDVLAVQYWALRSSQRYLIEGEAAVDALRKWAGAVFPVPYPTGFRDWEETYASVHLTATQHGVEGRSPYDAQLTLPDALVVRVTLDAGLPSQRVLGEFSKPWTYTLPAGVWGASCEVVSGADGRTYRNRSTVVGA